MQPPEEVERLERLARASLDGDRRAFADLSLAMWPFVEVAARRAARGADARDEVQELFARLLERLEASDFLGLRTFADWKARHPEKDFLDWLRIVIANLSRDRTRERLGRRREATDLPSAKCLLNELAKLAPLDDLSYRPPVTSDQTAREILEFAAKHLPPLQALALSAWIEGDSFEEMREKTGLATEGHAVRLVRAALATLRRRFNED